MPLPHQLVFNELNGDEIKVILLRRFRDLLDEAPFLQRHITLPRVRMQVQVTLDQWADQPTPERLQMSDTLTLIAEVCSAPVPGGKPPDQVRDENDLPVPSPSRGPRETGSHIAISDHSLENRVVESYPGLSIDRTGTGGTTDAGLAKMRNATVVNMDQGPAGLSMGGERGRIDVFKNARKG